MLDGNIPPKLTISVKEGSLLPKDSISIANQALELARMNKISNIDLYKRLEYPNPDELAANVWLEANAPHILYKDNQMVQEALGLLQPQAEEQAPAAEVPQNQIPIPEITEEGAGAPDRSTLPEVPITAG